MIGGGRNCDHYFVPFGIIVKLWNLRNWHEWTQFRSTNQQVYWVVQVIPYVSKGRSHRDCWYEASYGHLVNPSQEDKIMEFRKSNMINKNKQKIKWIEILM